MSDLLRMDYINSLPQPLWALKGTVWWPVYDIDVQTGLYRIDVMGKLDICHIGDTLRFRDADGVINDSETFYVDYKEESGELPTATPPDDAPQAADTPTAIELFLRSHK